MEEAGDREPRPPLPSVRRRPARDAPALGRSTADTPRRPSREDTSAADEAGENDDAPPLRVMTLEEWEQSWD